MEYKLFKAKTVNDAITDALIEFEITSDMLDYEVIEEGSTGLLGLFSKDAVIKAKKKEIVEEESEEFSIKDEISAATRVDLRSAGALRRPGKQNEKKKSPKKEDAQPEILKNDEPFEIKADAVGENEEKLDISVSGISAAKAKSKASKKPVYDNSEVEGILNLIFEKLEIKADIETTIDAEEKVVNINITGENTSDLIGKKGQTLDAIQYLASIIVNKKKGDYYRVKVDTNNYRTRRQKTLENQAKNVASKVKKTRRKVVMEPMNPYERRIIHSYLQSDKQVTTKSEGEEPNRKVVVYYKKA